MYNKVKLKGYIWNDISDRNGFSKFVFSTALYKPGRKAICTVFDAELVEQLKSLKGEEIALEGHIQIYDRQNVVVIDRIDDNPELELMNATTIGKQLGIASRKVNELLRNAGLIVAAEHGWQTTEEGSKYGETFCYESDGASVSQVKWKPEIIEVLKIQ